MKRKTYLDRYRVIANERGALAVLRRHGTAVTYKAEDTRDGSEVEVEVILAFGLEAKVREELHREGKAARALSHPNIPTLREFEEESDQFIYVWEHVAGTPLETWVQEHGPMPVGPALRIASQIVSALGAAAFQSLVHRAINPENVVLVPGQTPQGDWPMVKILQWIGTAPAGSKYAGKNMSSDSTSSYLSPEQLNDGVVNFQSEIYSLGATLWFLLTGAAPSTAGALPRLSGVPKPAMHLLDQMLARDPEQRPHDPVAFEESLRNCLEQVDRREAVGRKLGVPVAVAEPAAIKTTTHRPMPWKPLAFAALMLALVTVVAVLLPPTLHPGRWFAGSERSQPIGVPIGVPDSVARAASSYPDSNQTDFEDEVQPPAPAPAVVATSNATQPAPASSPAKSTASQAELAAMNATTVTPAEASSPDTPPAPVSASIENSQPMVGGDVTREAAASLRHAEAASEGSLAKVEREPATPAEGPAAETAEPPAYAVQEADATHRIREEEDTVDARPARAAIQEDEPAAAQPTGERVARLNGLPVRRAQPVEEEDLRDRRTARQVRRIRRIDGREVRLAEPIYEGQEVPGLPRRANRARFIGTTPDGEMVFEAPSAERGYVRPRR